MITKDDCLKLGFKELPHFTIMSNLTYDLGKNKSLSFGCIGTPNENLWICEHDYNNY